MSYTAESLAPNVINTNPTTPSEFNLPVKEYVGYDPKGKTTITGTSLADAKAASAEEPKSETTEIPLSPKLSAIARKEQAQRAKEKALADREKDLTEKLAKAEKYEELRQKIAAKDYSALDELGAEYEEIVKHELNKEAAKNPEQERIARLEEEQKALKKALEEKEVSEYQANQALWKQEIVRTIKENDDFSTIRELGAEDIVLQHINDSFEEDGVELTVDQAAKDIETALLERATKFASVSKVKNTVSGGKVLGPPKTTNSSKTITQNMTVTSTQTKPKPFHLLSESEQLAEAIRRVQSAKLQR